MKVAGVKYESLYKGSLILHIVPPFEASNFFRIQKGAEGGPNTEPQPFQGEDGKPKQTFKSLQSRVLV